MRLLGFVLALCVGLLLWGLSSALLSHGTPLGKMGNLEQIVFLTPIVLFAVPMGLLALHRNAPLLAVWIGALAPLLGFLNFGIGVDMVISKVHGSGTVAWPLALGWLGMTGLVLLLLLFDGWACRKAAREDAASR